MQADRAEPLPSEDVPIDVMESAQQELAQVDAAGRQRIADQWSAMPPAWREADRVVVRGTEWVLVTTGALFAGMVTLEVISRFVFSFSISFVNAAARLLLVWFFMLGTGLAMRHGAHVGFELLLSKLGVRQRRILTLIGLGVIAVFCVEMIWAGVHSMGPAMGQMEPGLGISLVWPILAIPVGFALLLYHTFVALWVEVRGQRSGGDSP